jgi:DNA primase
MARGCVLRRLDGGRPKVRSYPAADYPLDAPWLAWFHDARLSARGPLVVVEDVLSAMRLEQAGHSAVSLLGTGLSEAKALELRRWCRTVVIALDADAIGRAISHALRHSFEVRRLATDIKDMTEEQLTQWTTSLYSSLPASIRGTPAP